MARSAAIHEAFLSTFANSTLVESQTLPPKDSGHMIFMIRLPKMIPRPLEMLLSLRIPRIPTKISIPPCEQHHPQLRQTDNLEAV
jgi:hypothetical protein